MNSRPRRASITQRRNRRPAAEAVPARSASPATTDAPYTVQLERVREPAYLSALFYPYLAAAILFLAWRSSVVNWHIWFGPLSLVADVAGAVAVLTFLGCSRAVYLPVHRENTSDRVVDCLIPTHTEPLSIIEPTVIAALRVRGIRTVLVLGNRERPEVRAMAARLGARYHSRRSDKFAKAGNLNEGLKHTDAEFILTLDADHIVLPQFLERTLGYFDDPAVAFVQTPQTFYNTDTFLYRRAHGRDAGWWEQKLFYDCAQPVKNRWNASFYVGTGAVLRRSAIDDVGGFATSTVTEDIHTSVRMHANGWRSVFIPEPLAFGLEAQNLKQYYQQRKRWASGCLTLLFRTSDSPLWRPGLTVSQRINYIHATIMHGLALQRLFYLLLPTITLVMLRGPVVISIGYYGLAFLAYFAMTLAMMMLYGRGSYHIIHNDAYNGVNILAQIAALTAIVRPKRLFHLTQKSMARAERTMVKYIVWALGIIPLGGIAYGISMISSGDHSWLVVMSIAWNAANCVWMGSFLLYIERYERRPDELSDEGAPALDKYHSIIARFGENRAGAKVPSVISQGSKA